MIAVNQILRHQLSLKNHKFLMQRRELSGKPRFDHPCCVLGSALAWEIVELNQKLANYLQGSLQRVLVIKQNEHVLFFTEIKLWDFPPFALKIILFPNLDPFWIFIKLIFCQEVKVVFLLRTLPLIFFVFASCVDNPTQPIGDNFGQILARRKIIT